MLGFAPLSNTFVSGNTSSQLINFGNQEKNSKLVSYTILTPANISSSKLTAYVSLNPQFSSVSKMTAYLVLIPLPSGGPQLIMAM